MLASMHDTARVIPPDSTAPTRTRVGVRLLVLLLALAALRIGALVLHDPLLGVANNYDMIRVQACIDAYPDRPADIPPGSNSYNAPLQDYRFIHGVGAPCFLTSEALFAWAAWPGLAAWAQGSENGTFPLQFVGVLKATLLWGVAALFSWLWWRDGRRGWALGNAAVALFVLADPGITTFANTFYAEFAAVFFWYVTLAALALAYSRERLGSAGRIVLASLLALAILSKIQHVVLGVFVLGVVLLLAWTRRCPPRGTLPALLVGAVLATAVQGWHMQSPFTRTIHDANQTNTFLYAALGLSTDPARTAAALGLPPDCAAHAGKSWFTPGVPEQHPCPAVLDASRARLLTLAWRDPGTLARMLRTTLERSRAFVVPVLGKVEGRELAPLPRYQLSVDTLIVALPTPLFAIWLLLPGLLAAARLLRPNGPPAGHVLLLALGLLPWLTLAVVAFGDGLADPAKQSHLGVASALAWWVIVGCCLLSNRTKTIV